MLEADFSVSFMNAFQPSKDLKGLSGLAISNSSEVKKAHARAQVEVERRSFGSSWSWIHDRSRWLDSTLGCDSEAD